MSVASLSATSCAILRHAYKNSISKTEQRIVRKFPEVEKAEVLYDHGIYPFVEFTIEITFHDGRKLLLIRVNTNLKGNILLRQIGEYGVRVYFYDRNGFGAIAAVEMDLLSRETGIQLDSVGDVIDHYHDIYSYVDKLEDRYTAAEIRRIDIADARTWVLQYPSQFNVIEYDGRENIIFKEIWESTESYWYY